MSSILRTPARLSLSLTLGAVLLFGIFSAVQGLSFTAYWRRHFYQQEQLGSWSLAEQISRQFDASLSPNIDFASLRRTADEILEVNPNIEIYLVEPTGTVGAVFSREPQTVLPSQVDLLPIKDFLRTGARINAPMFASDPQMPSRSVIFSAARARVSEDGGFVFVVLKSRRAARIQVRAFDEGSYFGIAFSSLVALVIASVVGYFISRHLVLRLRNLMAAVRRLDHGDLSARVESHGRDEIAELGRAVNQMASSLQSTHAELEKKDMLRRELISNIWHDIRGPIAVLQGLGTMLVNEQQTESASIVAESVVANARQLNHFLDELRALSELETGELTIRRDAVDLVDVCEETHTAVLPLAQQSEVDLRLALPESDVPYAAGDSALLSRLLRNLVENAIRYTPKQGIVTIQLEHLEVGLALSVEDTGMGISEEELSRVFERHFQSRAGNEERYGSGGLGLAIVRKIAEAHASEVTVESSPGRGAKFTVLLQNFKSEKNPPDERERESPAVPSAAKQ